jgi:glycosyltransferase involved in cell wall biosynthesis
MIPVPGLLGNEHGDYSYDERRSALKMVEYLCAGVPYVATDAFPYREYKNYGKLVKNSPEAWYKALKARVDSLPHFKREAQNRKSWALRKLTIEANTEKLMKFYQGIIIDVQARRGNRLPEVLYID